MIFFSVAWGICGIGDLTTLSRAGKKIFFHCFGKTLFVPACCLVFFPLFIQRISAASVIHDRTHNSFIGRSISDFFRHMRKRPRDRSFAHRFWPSDRHGSPKTLYCCFVSHRAHVFLRHIPRRMYGFMADHGFDHQRGNSSFFATGPRRRRFGIRHAFRAGRASFGSRCHRARA